MDSRSQIRALVLFRIAFLVMMMGSTAVLWFFYQENPAAQVIELCLIGLGFSVISGILSRLLNKRWLPGVIWAQVIWDLGAAAYLMHGMNAVMSISLALFFIQIVFASVVIGSRGAVVSSLISACLVTYLAVDGQHLNDILNTKALPPLIFVQSCILFLGGCLAYFARNRERMRKSLDQTESALKDLSSLHAAIINYSPSGILSIDREGRVILMNRMAETILGQNLIGKSLAVGPFAELFNRADRSESRMEIRGESRSIGHQRVELPDMQGWLVIFQDVTDMREMESRMKVNDKLASVGQLAAGIAHEIRNPLASLSGSVQMLRAEMPQESASEKLMQIVLRETDRLDGLLKNFLMYAKPSELRPEAVSLRKHCLEMIELIQNRVGKKVRYQLDIAERLECRCDPLQLSQILWNLILNAAQASLEGGEVKISARELNPFDGARIRFEVSDRGLGIHESVRGKIFDPFFTTKPEGTGLGLPLVFQMVKAHGGEIGVESEEGRGSLFWFELYRDGPKTEGRMISSSAA